VQSAPQSIPDGDDVTVPLPVPSGLTVSTYRFNVKVAVTEWAASMLTMQAPEPVQAPAQEMKLDPGAGDGVSVTRVPWS
jgi:hypothetical protein